MPGTAWQKACRRPSGSTSGRSVVAKTTPEVPRVSATIPGPDRAHAHRLGGLVAAAGHDRRAGLQPGGCGGLGGDVPGDLAGLR